MPPLFVKAMANAMWPIAVAITGGLVAVDALIRRRRTR
jgi:hypothetical protein